MKLLLHIVPPRHGDNRGFFGETYSRRRYAEMGIDVEFVQDNHSLSRTVGTLRGLHFQAPPAAQGKLYDAVVERSLTWQWIYVWVAQLTDSGKVTS